MAVELRVGFHRQLNEIEASVTRLFAMVAEGIAAATDALLSGDRDVMAVLDERELSINALCGEVEDLVCEAITLQAPVASDLRFLLAVLRLAPELERSHDLVEHIARRGARAMAGELTPRARGLIGQMGALGTGMWRTAGEAFLERDPTAAQRLAEQDDHMDELRSLLVAEVAAGAVSFPVAMDTILIGRFYERLGDHAVNVARRIAYLAGPRTA